MPGLISTNDRNGTDAHLKLRVIICGAGLGGLGAAIALRRKGHEVVVLEGAAQLSEVGAGVQIPPNSSRILEGYGIGDRIRELAVRPQNIAIKRYETGQVLGLTPLHPRLTKVYGHPYLLIHRADYQKLLFEEAMALEVQFHFSTRIISLNQDRTSVVTVDGRQFEGDVVVGADGIKSKIREFVIPEEIIEPSSSSNCAYRAIVPREAMMADPDSAALMHDVNSNAWIGHRKHVMAYPIRHGTMYNLVMSHPGQAAAGKWNEPGDLNKMKATYSNFDPVIKRVLEKVTDCLKWKLADLPPLTNWVSKSGTVVLIGDAAHAMVPYLAQGASMAIEDGATLAECLSCVEKREEIPKYLAAFEQIRKPRCERIQTCSRLNGNMWHMPDGPEQEARDMALKRDDFEDDVQQQDLEGQNVNLWSDKGFQPWLFGYDVFGETRKILDDMR